MAVVEHVFVLMLENRSFDHLLGFSGITGTDAVTGLPTSLEGVSGDLANVYNGQTYPAKSPADFRLEVDPGHEFPQVVEQLCGEGAAYHPGQPYPPVNCSGFAACYAEVNAAARGNASPGEILMGYSAAQLPVLNKLATEFAVCDSWHASVPGPTWPNRLFVHAASSNGLDHSPTSAEILVWELGDGFDFPNGTIFDRLEAKGLSHRLYAGDDFPMVAALKGIHLDDIRHYSLLAGDLQRASYPYDYIFIEPSYDLQNDYRSSSSQHPLGDVTRGEALIKATYEAIRNSPVWETSVLIVTWDEHGGFFDHVAPPAAISPGDSAESVGHNKFGFDFSQYGVRVPAIVVSPIVPRNVIDHRLYDHASVPATIEALFELDAMTNRDATANTILSLLSLAAARTDAPTQLPSPAMSAEAAIANGHALVVETLYGVEDMPVVARPEASINDGNLPIVVHGAMRQDLELSGPAQHDQIIAQVAALKTRADAAHYIGSVQAKITAAGSHQ